MIKIGGSDGPRRVNPIEPTGRAGEKRKDEPVRDPKPARKPEAEDVPAKPRPDAGEGKGENIDIDV